MSWIGFLVVTLVTLFPLVLMLRRARSVAPAPVTARRSALTLYRRQLDDLERDRQSGLLPGSEYAAAQLEIQRRLLQADSLEDRIPTGQHGDGRKILLLCAVLPVAGFGLYALNGHPSLPPQPHRAVSRAVSPEMQALFEKLGRQVAALSPQDPDYVSQSVLLGQVDEATGRIDEALRAYRQALAIRFIPELAVQIAELQVRRDGHIGADSLALYRKALDAAPADAPWRLAVEARIAAGEHEAAP